MKKRIIIICLILASIIEANAQNGSGPRATSTIRRPVFTGGGALGTGASSTGTALTFGQSFAKNKKVGCRIVQIGAQTGLDTDSIVFDANCNIIAGFQNGVQVLGIKQSNATLINTQNFSIYPNPTYGLLYLSSTEMSNDFIVQIYSMNGELMHTDTWLKGETKQLNIEALSPAMYLVRCMSKDGKTIHKKLINKL